MILVSGATGNVGREVVRQLNAKNAHTRVLVRRIDPETEALRTHGVEIALGDYDQAYTLRGGLSGIESAYLVTPTNPLLFVQEERFLASAEAVGVRKIVKQSCIGAQRMPGYLAGREHRRSEEEIAWSRLEWVILRPSVLMTELLRLADEVRRSGRLRVPDRKGRIAFVDPRDVASVAAAVLTERGHAGKIYEVTGPEAVSYEEIAERLARLTGTPIELEIVDEGTMREELLARQVPAWNVDANLELQALGRRGELAGVTDTLFRVTGDEPRTIDAFLREHARLFAGTGAQPPAPAF